MTIVIPMAGESSRFTKVGLPPKYTLEIKDGISLFDAAICSFRKWFATADFIIIVKDDKAKKYVEKRISMLGIQNYKIINLNFLTKGQAETVYLGLKEAGIDDLGDELMIFNIDTIRYNLELPKDEIWDTLFDVFYDEDATNEWSFAQVKSNSNDIIKTAEKQKISNWCSTGLYIFRSIWLYVDAYERAIKDNQYNYYIAPLYNKLKGMNNRILICDKEDVDFAGTPEQYNNIVQRCKNIDF